MGAPPPMAPPPSDTSPRIWLYRELGVYALRYSPWIIWALVGLLRAFRH